MAAPRDLPNWRQLLMWAGMRNQRKRESLCAALDTMSIGDAVDNLLHFHNIPYWKFMGNHVFMFLLCEKDPGMAQRLIAMAQACVKNGLSSIKCLMRNACKYGNRAAFHLLLDAGFDANKGVDGNPLWCIACIGKDPSMARYLVESVGITYTITSDEVPTFFIAACSSGSLKLVRYAASLGVGDVNEESAYGCTALSNACDCGSLDIACYLIEELGANALHQPEYKLLLLLRAYHSGNLALVRYIEERAGVQPHTGALVPHMASLDLTYVGLDVLQHLVACGHANLSLPMLGGKTTFFHAAERMKDARCRVVAEYMLCELLLSADDIDSACHFAALESTEDTAMLAHARDIQAWNALTREAPWTPERHALYPPAFDKRVRVLLVGHGRRGCILASMPLELIFMIIARMACRPWHDIDASVPRPFVPSEADNVYGPLHWRVRTGHGDA